MAIPLDASLMAVQFVGSIDVIAVLFGIGGIVFKKCNGILNVLKRAR